MGKVKVSSVSAALERSCPSAAAAAADAGASEDDEEFIEGVRVFWPAEPVVNRFAVTLLLTIGAVVGCPIAAVRHVAR